MVKKTRKEIVEEINSISEQRKKLLSKGDRMSEEDWQAEQKLQKKVDKYVDLLIEMDDHLEYS